MEEQIFEMLEVETPVSEKVEQEILEKLRKGPYKKVFLDLERWLEEKGGAGKVESIGVYADFAWGEKKALISLFPEIDDLDLRLEFLKDAETGKVKKDLFLELSEPVVKLPLPGWLTLLGAEEYNEWMFKSEAEEKISAFEEELKEAKERIEKV